MVIRFYDFKFNLIHISPEFISSSWNVYFNKDGTFEAHFPINSEVLSVVTENKYLVACQDGFSAIITLAMLFSPFLGYYSASYILTLIKK